MRRSMRRSGRRMPSRTGPHLFRDRTPGGVDKFHARRMSAWKERVGRGEMAGRSEEHTSELQSLMRISYAVFCLKKKKPQSNTMTCGVRDCTIKQPAVQLATNERNSDIHKRN